MTRTTIIVLAHNEERRIARCLESLPLGEAGVTVHVAINGTTDRTAEIARSFAGVHVHDWAEGGKSLSWNRIMLDTPGVTGDVFVFVDGDAEIQPNSVEALVQTLRANPAANAAAGLPANGRKAEAYRAETIASHGLFGDFYALSGDFVRRLRASGVRLPVDLIGDDSLIGALAKTGLANEDDWQETRIVPCLEAGFLCEPTTISPASIRNQYRRMINYSVRRFQNRIVTAIMRGPGPAGLPNKMAELYGEWLPQFTPRRDPQLWWFDRTALARMHAKAFPK